MYIAGIHVSNERLTEGIVTSSLFLGVFATIYSNQKAFRAAKEKGGPVKSMPKTLLGKIVTPLHAAVTIIPPVTYLIAIPLNGGVQPGFISRWALPKAGLCEPILSALRVVGCLGLAVGWKTLTLSRDTLGQAFHFVGVREKTKVVSTGPYAVVRHPLYSSALAQHLALSLMFWNYIPLVTFVICAATFVAKIPIEEGLIEADAEIGPEYTEYKKKVPYRLIPRVW